MKATWKLVGFELRINPTIPKTYKAPDHTAATNGTKQHQLTAETQ